MATVKQRCRLSGKDFLVSDEEQEILARIGILHPAIAEPLPMPTTHPWVFARQILSHSNVYHLYQGRSAFSRESLLSRYQAGSGYKVCTVEEFWDEKIDNTERGRAFDFSKPFFQQFDELLHSIYLLPLNVTNTENSSYVNAAVNLKNCYLCFVTYESQDCMYCYAVSQSHDCVDCVHVRSSQFCYQCLHIEQCYECQHCSDCRNSSSCFGCVDCVGCQECIGCVGLRNTRYHVFNEQYSKESFQIYLSGLRLGDRATRASLLSRCREFIASQNHRINHNINCEDCTGDYLVNSKNLTDCHFSNDCQDCGYLLYARHAKDAWRGVAEKAELLYQSAGYPGSYHTLYSFNIVGGEGNIYSHGLYNSCSHCFGCAFLKGKSYCILNRPYQKEEYLELSRCIMQHMKTTGEWGMFFPSQLSPHGYEESLVDAWLNPIPLEEAQQRGFIMTPRPRHLADGHSLDAGSVPEDIAEVSEASVLGRPIACERSREVFGYSRAEIQYYKRFQIPLPTLHWRERIANLLNAMQRIPAV
jgi:hypothetical protein